MHVELINMWFFDMLQSWGSLDFQVYFTLKATNVGYGYWSHDLGGHTQPSPPELYTRLAQASH